MKGILFIFYYLKKKLESYSWKAPVKGYLKKKNNPTWSSQYTRSHEKLNNSIFIVRIFKRTTKRRKQKTHRESLTDTLARCIHESASFDHDILVIPVFITLPPILYL